MKNEIFITSGDLKGRKVRTPGGSTHPMGARERLALFNMLADVVPGAKVLDAYAGSGALGIEALSRGAAQVVFVEKNPQAVNTIRENLRNLGQAGEVWQKDALSIGEATHASFDLVIADPPYDRYMPEMILKLSDLVADGGVLAVSTPELPPEIPGFCLVKTRKYASAQVSIYLKHMI